MPAAEITRAPDWALWGTHSPSTLSHHGEGCCTAARAWFLAMNRSMWRGEGGPVWIRRRFDWGPTRWPLHWCDAMEAKEIDCGAHAALAVEAFRARGVLAVPVQLVQRYEPQNVPHWHHRWNEHGACPTWADGELVYHEACAVIDGDSARIWNPTASAWASPENVRGYASIVAVRIGGDAGTGERVTWGDHHLTLGEWGSVAESTNGHNG